MKSGSHCTAITFGEKNCFSSAKGLNQTMLQHTVPFPDAYGAVSKTLLELNEGHNSRTWPLFILMGGEEGVVQLLSLLDIFHQFRFGYFGKGGELAGGKRVLFLHFQGKGEPLVSGEVSGSGFVEKLQAFVVT